MALLVHAADQVLVAGDHLPHQEKGGLHPPLGQAVQQGLGGGAAGPVVKGEGDEGPVGLHLGLGVRREGGGGPRPDGPGQEEGQEEHQQNRFSFVRHPPASLRSFSEVVCPKGNVFFEKKLERNMKREAGFAGLPLFSF